MAKVLIVDDDKMICEMLSCQVKEMGYQVEYVHSLKSAYKKVCCDDIDVVFLDVQLPDGNGLDVIPAIRETPSSPEVIIITGSGDPNGAELAINNGAWDYIEKQSSLKEIILSLKRAIQYREEKLLKKTPVVLNLKGIIGSSKPFLQCLNLLAQAAISDVNVLVTGETGTGKELFSWAIHENSRRSEKSFVVVDCTALPETLVESILFGHRKGAFTGAVQDQIGLVKQADGGTLFLDEIGELPFSLQKTFLRVLELHRFRPIGSQTEVTSNFRLIAATNRNLDNMVQSGEFRKDLLYRLRSFNIHIQPLRERKEDIRDIAAYYIRSICERYGISIKGYSPEFLYALTEYDWPGNVRELVNTMEWVISNARDKHTLFPTNLPPNIRIHLARASVSKKKSDEKIPYTQFLPYKDFLNDSGKEYLSSLMNSTNGDVREACRISGLSRSRLYGLLKQFKLSSPQ
ncbi:sigma-54 dependent transcriptional regulator [bacterium]|nr:sigma-54 dependent transcriptional regulator [bacterium]